MLFLPIIPYILTFTYAVYIAHSYFRTLFWEKTRERSERGVRLPERRVQPHNIYIGDEMTRVAFGVQPYIYIYINEIGFSWCVIMSYNVSLRIQILLSQLSSFFIIHVDWTIILNIKWWNIYIYIYYDVVLKFFFYMLFWVSGTIRFYQ